MLVAAPGERFDFHNDGRCGIESTGNVPIQIGPYILSGNYLICPLPTNRSRTHGIYPHYCANRSTAVSSYPKAHAPIQPDLSLAGLYLRTHITVLSDILSGFDMTKRGSYSMTAPFEVRYHLAEYFVEIAVDVRNGRIFRITALPGYRGTCLGGITVGMLVSDAKRREPRLYYNEQDELLLCSGVRGISLDVEEIDPSPEIVPGLPISAISVFASEIEDITEENVDWYLPANPFSTP